MATPMEVGMATQMETGMTTPMETSMDTKEERKLSIQMKTVQAVFTGPIHPVMWRKVALRGRRTERESGGQGRLTIGTST